MCFMQEFVLLFLIFFSQTVHLSWSFSEDTLMSLIIEACSHWNTKQVINQSNQQKNKLMRIYLFLLNVVQV